MKLLLVEDDRAIAAAVKRGLEAEGFTVDVALDGAEGLWQATEYEYDLLGNRTKLVERDLTGRTSTGPIETTYGYGYGTEEGDQPRTLDFSVRNARFIETAPAHLTDDVLSRLAPLVT